MSAQLGESGEMLCMNGEFDASVYMSEELNRQLRNVCQDLTYRCIAVLAEKFNFKAEEAYNLLNLSKIKVERKGGMKVKVSNAPKVETPKPKFPLPYNGEFNEACCHALRQNNGLYTQCTGHINKNSVVKQFCKSCATTMQKNGAEEPDYGTIQQRMAVDIFDYTDPKGNKPIAYTKVMKKYKISQEEVLEEASKFNMNIDPRHFVVPAEDSKRGRPKSKASEPKAKGAKGRPKKEKKVIAIEGETDDFFSVLVSEAFANEELPKKKADKSEEEKEAERLAKEAEKEAKRLALEKAKAEKEAKLAAEKAEKEAKKEAERLEREAKKKAEQEAKRLKEEKRLKEKAEKEAKLAAEKAAKPQKSSKKATPKASSDAPESVVDDEHQEVVKKFEFEGKKYLKSKNTGIIYDYTEYITNGEQVIVGKWNETTKKIDFNDNGEESEESEEESQEEYEM